MRSRLLVMGLVACGSAAPKPVEVVKPAELVLLDPGSEPRQVVRLSVPAHTVERQELQLDLAMSQTIENTVLETAHTYSHLPTIHAVVRIEVTGVEPDGTMDVHTQTESASYDEVVADPKLRKAADAEVASLRRTHTEYRLSPAGVTTANMQMLALDARFPDVPIGVGASWRVTSTILSRGVQWTRTTIFHLRALDDMGASVESEFSATAAPQTISVDPNSSTEITDGHADGHSLFLIPLHSLVSTGGSHAAVDTALQLVRRHLRIRSQVQMQQDVTMKPATR